MRLFKIIVLVIGAFAALFFVLIQFLPHGKHETNLLCVIQYPFLGKIMEARLERYKPQLQPVVSALESYKHDHGYYPLKLEDLAPQYIQGIDSHIFNYMSRTNRDAIGVYDEDCMAKRKIEIETYKQAETDARRCYQEKFHTPENQPLAIAEMLKACPESFPSTYDEIKKELGMGNKCWKGFKGYSVESYADDFCPPRVLRTERSEAGEQTWMLQFGTGK